MLLRIIIAAGWLLFASYWWISAKGVKRNIRRISWRWEIGFRILVFVAVIAIIRVPGARRFFENATSAAINTLEGAVGLIVCFVGFGIAVCARRHLGRNWGMPMTLKEGHELVTTGPYRYIRHPIYTGFLLAMLGSALAMSRIWLLPFAAMLVYSIYSASTEERLMRQQFPSRYDQYRQHTKRFIPFVI